MYFTTIFWQNNVITSRYVQMNNTHIDTPNGFASPDQPRTGLQGYYSSVPYLANELQRSHVISAIISFSVL